MKIESIYFRCPQEVGNGSEINFFGEGCYNVGDEIDKGFFITEISIGNITYGNAPFAQIFVNGNLWCEIHEHSITRIFYDVAT